jgi:hypothetical protein
MTGPERRIYRFVLIALAVIWLSIIVTFSPWGIARPRVAESTVKTFAQRHVHRPFASNHDFTLTLQSIAAPTWK